MAEEHPLEELDFKTFDYIPEEKKVVVSTGAHFDIDSLSTWHNRRPLNENDLKIPTPGKYILDPNF